MLRPVHFPVGFHRFSQRLKPTDPKNPMTKAINAHSNALTLVGYAATNVQAARTAGYTIPEAKGSLMMPRNPWLRLSN